MYSEEEQKILDKWRRKLHCSIHVLIEIIRDCKKENVNFDDFMNFCIQNGWVSWGLTIEEIKKYKEEIINEVDRRNIPINE